MILLKLNDDHQKKIYFKDHNNTTKRSKKLNITHFHTHGFKDTRTFSIMNGKHCIFLPSSVLVQF